MAPFHFSPRPNRAGEIAWRDWSAQSFEEAQAAQKPVLLALSAVWCHWCHVMDETSYSDDAVIAAINERYIPIRVDADERPDVNSRYNLGGWPTTAFLTPDGYLLGGATYVPPQAMGPLLNEVAKAWVEQRSEIDTRIAQRIERVSAAEKPDGGQLREAIVTTVLASIDEIYDETNAGFGHDQKFPHVAILNLLLLEYRRHGDLRRLTMVLATLRAMALGGMYDHVEGGFYRYSTTPDWTVPHFEKMLEDHAGLLPLYARAWSMTGEQALFDAMQRSLAYLRAKLLSAQTGLFGGSQDADEHYYSLPLAERRSLDEPYIDRTVYVNWNAAMASALYACALATNDDLPAREASRTLDAIDSGLRDARGLCYHFMRPGEAPQLPAFLNDQAAYLRALLDAHETTGETRFYERALAHAQLIFDMFSADDGAFADRIAADEALGMLRFADRPLPDNASVADSFLRLAAMSGDDRWHARAERTLRAFSERYAQQRHFAAAYAAAVARALGGGTSVTIVGGQDSTHDLRRVANGLRDPLLTVVTVGDEKQAEARGFHIGREAAAYLCRGTSCSAPITDPEKLSEALVPA